MSKKPFLIFPQSTRIDRSKRPQGSGGIHLPSKDDQVKRFGKKMSNLDRVLQNESAYLAASPHGLAPEMILVLEIAGEIGDFYKAVANTPGMEFLAELEDERDEDEYFYRINKEGEKTDGLIKARLFLTMTNQQALFELRRYWQEYQKNKDNQEFAWGTTKFRELFEHFIDLRPYGIKDRIRDTGLEEYLAELRENKFESVKFEIELAFKSNPEQNQRSFEKVAQLLSQNEGKVFSNSRITLSEINYHAFIAEAPIGCFDELSESTAITFLKAQQILYFRPVGQLIAGPADTNGEFPRTEASSVSVKIDKNTIKIAILDGLPLNNHSMLKNTLIDDPDDFGQNYLAEKRIHGTAMASIVIHGDLSNGESLNYPVYIRPVLKPIPNVDGEFLPDDVLPIDLVHRSVLRLFEGDENQSPIAPNVKIINFSIGDAYRPFHTNISTWARLMDWLSHKYDVLFVISAGNYVGDLFLNISNNKIDGMSVSDLEQSVIDNIISEMFDRKILTPSESINSLTIGASHSDGSNIAGINSQRKNLISQSNLCSPISRIGFGFKRSVKPEILMPGGRKIFRKAPIQNHADKTLFKPELFPVSQVPPGILAATVGKPGEINAVGFVSGTSASAALTSHTGGKILEMLEQLNSADQKISLEFYTVITKALLVHGANWGNERFAIENALKKVSAGSNPTKRQVMPFIGYGSVDQTRVIDCTDFRVTLIGFGKVKKDTADLFRFPLPPSISEKSLYKRLTITLAWLSPINFKSFRYRKSHLYYNNLAQNSQTAAEHLSLERSAYDFTAAQNGTLQHDVLEGENADAFVVGDHIEIKINCREDASGLAAKDLTKYALIVTLEVKEENEIPIYDEIEQLISVPVRTRVRANK